MDKIVELINNKYKQLYNTWNKCTEDLLDAMPRDDYGQLVHSLREANMACVHRCVRVNKFSK